MTQHITIRNDFDRNGVRCYERAGKGSYLRVAEDPNNGAFVLVSSPGSGDSVGMTLDAAGVVELIQVLKAIRDAEPAK